MKSYHFNPDLAFIKSDWKGNIKIYDKFVFEQTIEEIPFSAIAKYAILPNPQKKEKKEDSNPKFKDVRIPSTSFQKDRATEKGGRKCKSRTSTSIGECGAKKKVCIGLQEEGIQERI